MNILVTGGAGFIGSNLVDALLGKGHEVTVWDNFSTGRREWLPEHDDLTIMQGDVAELCADDDSEYDAVFHFQANADVRHGQNNRLRDFEQNVLRTRSLLEFCVQRKVKDIIFASSAAVYGEPDVFPTPESHAGIQTSAYGASKLACEALIQAYSNYFGFRWWIFRFVSFTGRHYHHGVIVDFVNKLKANPRELQILGNGQQRKSYLDVQDGVLAMMTAWKSGVCCIYNLGHHESMTVFKLADIVCEEMKCVSADFVISDEERGWIGDAPRVQLDTKRIELLGWKPTVSIEDSVRATVRELLNRK